MTRRVLSLLTSVLVVLLASCSNKGEPSSKADSPPTNTSAEQRRQLYDRKVGVLREQSARAQQLIDQFPKELLDLDALARSVPTPESAFAFVRDHIALEPYAGVMKGAIGTLTSRGGNAIDRALLLSAILARGGVTSKIAHGHLSRAQAEALLRQVVGAPDAFEQIAEAIPAIPPTALSDRDRQRAAPILAEAESRARTHHLEAEAIIRTLAASIERAGLPHRQDRRESQLTALQDHFWVQATIGNRQVDLDPSFKEAGPGQRPAEVAEIFSPDNMPQAAYQHLQIRAIADVLEGGAVTSREILKAEARVTDLVDANIRVAVEPQALARGQNTFAVTIAMGSALTVTRPFELRSKSAGLGAGGAGGSFFGALGGDEPAAPTPQNPPGAVLGRLAIEVTSTAPALPDARYRRVVMDRLDGDAQSPHLLPGMEDDDSVRTLLMQVWDGAIAVGASQPLQMFRGQLQSLNSQYPVMEKALNDVYLGRPMGSAAWGPPQIPPQLLGFFVYSSLTQHAVVATDTARLRMFQLRPQLAFFRHGGVVHDWSKPGELRRIQDSIDLINMPFDFIGDRDAAGRVSLRVGVADTSLERAFARQSGDFNTLPLTKAAGDQKIQLVTLSPAEPAAVDHIEVPAAIRDVLRGELAGGRRLVAPSALVALNQVRTFGWWSIDPESGVPLGQMELGAGQAVSETAALNKSLLTGGHTFSKFYGGMLGCFFVEAADQLVPPESPHPITPTFSFSKHHYVPGLPTIESGKGLAPCLVERMCEAMVEYAFLAAESAAWVAEVNHLQEMIVEIAGLIGPTAVSTWMGACTD
jgi:hypothetical protein